MTFEPLKQTVARVEALLPATTEPRRGTAFLISSELVLTCAHCIGDRVSHCELPKLHFLHWKEGNERQATILHLDWDNDIAVLKLLKAAPVEPIPWIRRGTTGDPWGAFGYPEPVGTDGHVFTGSIKDANACFRDEDVMALTCDDASNRLGGASGSPVMVGTYIAGMLTNQLLGYTSIDDDTQPFFKTVYAIPIERLHASSQVFAFVSSPVPTRESRALQRAVGLASAAMLKRITADGKYDPDRYVERHDIGAGFDEFMAQDENRVFLVVAKAGAGKTTALGHLALNQIQGPGLYFRGGVDGYSKDDLQTLVQSVFLQPISETTAMPFEWNDLMKALDQNGAVLTMIIDAINETKFEEIPERRKELQLLLEFVEPLPIRVVISCRDVFWRFFIDPRGQTNDFWWRYVYDSTYQARCLEAREQVRKKFAEAERRGEQKEQAANIAKTAEEEVQARADAAAKLVTHRPSLMLGDFTPGELSVALDRYQLRVESDQLKAQLSHPLLLHLYAEVAAAHGISELTTQGALLERYVEYKLGSVKNVLPSHDADSGNRLLGDLAVEMRRSRYGKIKGDVLDTLVARRPDLQAVRTYLLDEGIILEYFDDGLVGFQFDALFEYILSRQVAAELKNANTEGFIQKLADALAAEAARFESLVGAIEYCATDVEITDAACCRRFLVALADTTSFGRDIFLRIVAQLSEPLHEQVAASLLTALGDQSVIGKLARDAFSHAMDTSPSRAAAFVTTLVSDANDVALGRCAEAMRDPRLPLEQRVSIVAQLLRSPSPDVAVAAVATLTDILGYRAARYSSGNLLYASPDSVKPLFGAALNGDMSFPGLMHFVAEFLPETVGRVDAGETGKIAAALIGRSEFTMVIHARSLLPLLYEWITQESDDIAVLVEVTHNRPVLSLQFSGLIMKILSNEPEHRVWLLRTLLRAALVKGPGMNVAWAMLVQALELLPDIIDEVTASLTPSEAVELDKQLKVRGLTHIRGLKKSSLAFSDIVGTASMSVLSCLGLLPWLPEVSLNGWAGPITGPALAAIALQVGVVFLFADLSQAAMIRLRPAVKWQIAALQAGTAAALYAFPLPLVSFLVLAGALAFVLILSSIRSASGSIIRDAFNMILQLISCGATGVVAAPAIWALGSRFSVVGAMLIVPAAWRIVRVWALPFYMLVSGSFALSVLRAAVTVGVAIALSGTWRGSLSDIIGTTLLGVLIVNFPVILVLAFKNGNLRGSPGWPIIGSTCAVTALAVALLVAFSLWVWVLVVLVTAILLVLPAAGPKA
jgi:hypothetical protein